MKTVAKLAVLALSSLLTLGCSVFGARTSKEPAFRVELEEDGKEIREYQPYLVARTAIEGDFDQAGREGFRLLFDYISGKNAGDQTISMTAPVVQERKGTEIAMTAPVLQERSGKIWSVAFVMPAHFTLETAPEPKDERVVIEQVPAQRVAVLRYSGFVSAEDTSQRAKQLETWVEAKGLRATSAARSARYDPPFTLPFLRRNEVHLTVEAPLPE